MQPWQNYSTNNYPQYQSQFNPHMQRMENLQQFQQAIQQPMSPTQMSGTSQFTPLGKIVESVDMVKATDIPMDGSMYYFPTADGNMIFSKQWMPNCQTRILTFKPVLDDNPNTSSQNEEKLNFEVLGQVLEGIQNDIKTLTDKIDKIKPTRAKKEVQDDAE